MTKFFAWYRRAIWFHLLFLGFYCSVVMGRTMRGEQTFGMFIFDTVILYLAVDSVFRAIEIRKTDKLEDNNDQNRD